MNHPAIETIVFDIGRVLVHFSLDGLVEFLQTRGAPFQTSADFVANTLMLPYEHGTVSTEEFLASIQQHLTSPVSTAELAERWQEIFTPIPEMLEMMWSTKDRYQTLLLSNTNPLHWEYLNREYRLIEAVHGAVTSCEVGAMKPSEKIFHSLEQRYQIVPETTVLIDDIHSHIAMAESRGWKGIHYVGFEQTVAALADLGVKVSR